MAPYLACSTYVQCVYGLKNVYTRTQCCQLDELTQKWVSCDKTSVKVRAHLHYVTKLCNIASHTSGHIY